MHPTTTSSTWRNLHVVLVVVVRDVAIVSTFLVVVRATFGVACPIRASCVTVKYFSGCLLWYSVVTSVLCHSVQIGRSQSGWDSISTF